MLPGSAPAYVTDLPMLRACHQAAGLCCSKLVTSCTSSMPGMGTQSRTILGSPAGQQADGDHAGCKTAPQMPSGAEPVTGSLFEICA
jgi:hypothetical protein